MAASKKAATKKGTAKTKTEKKSPATRKIEAEVNDQLDEKKIDDVVPEQQEQSEPEGPKEIEIKEKASIKYFYSIEEKMQLADKMTTASKDKDALELELKEIKKRYSLQIEEVVNKFYQYRNLHDQGYEYRDQMCIVKMNTPSIGKKTYISELSGEPVDVKDMLPSDYQIKLFEDPIEEVATEAIQDNLQGD